jgi:hypothetical protein
MIHLWAARLSPLISTERSSTCARRTSARHQQAAREVLDVELGEARVLELMSTGQPIREHMALLDGDAAHLLVASFVECYLLERDGWARPFPE